MSIPILTPAQFEAALADLAERVPLSVALTDIDHFNELNDTLGHDVGDAALRAFERTLTGSLPPDAVVGRVHGDSYAVALPETTAESALIVLEEIRVHFSSRKPQGVPRRVQVSIGVAALPPHAKTAEQLLRAADEALFRAKREGRDRVAIFVEDKMTLKSNYYSKAQLDRLAKLSAATARTEASLLREGLEDLLGKYAGEL
jgi:diguanylate cyclase (GGDEF)-like protein